MSALPCLSLLSPISHWRPSDCWRRRAVAISIQFHCLQSIARNGHEVCRVHLLSASCDPSVPTPPPPHTHAYKQSPVYKRTHIVVVYK